MVAVCDDFAETFREEHRDARDHLLELMAAFDAHDTTRARRAVAALTAVIGPHFRYEEESLLPRLMPVVGEEHVDRLFAEHDAVIRDVRRLLELADRTRIDPLRAERGIELARRVLSHVGECDGLSLMAETLSCDQVIDVLAARDAALEKNLDLLTWAGTVRARDTGGTI
ncbi:hemerythrin domain-containing protein [Nonomuraea sp. NPDC004354]